MTNLISGLQVTVDAQELQDLCQAAAQHHRDRAGFYRQQEAHFQGGDAQPAHFTGGDPIRACQEKAAEHIRQAEEMAFIADHLDMGARYLLERDDLVRLGICKRRW